MIQRTFPAGALDAVTPDVKKTVNDNNQALGVTWEHSFANADRTRTFCLYTGPSEAAVREAAKRSSMPIDSVTEVPHIIYPK
jgi:hypothetical protein